MFTIKNNVFNVKNKGYEYAETSFCRISIIRNSASSGLIIKLTVILDNFFYFVYISFYVTTKSFFSIAIYYFISLLHEA